MTDELCAREGCGAPKAWHTKKSTLEELHYGHEAIWPDVEEGYCVGRKCTCRGFLAPEPPKPYVVGIAVSRIDGIPGDTRMTFDAEEFTPLDEYLAAHPQPAPSQAFLDEVIHGDTLDAALEILESTFSPCEPGCCCIIHPMRRVMDLVAEYRRAPVQQPAPALCICGGTADEHDPVTGRCQHKAHRMLYSDSGSVIERLRCGCQKFAAQP